MGSKRRKTHQTEDQYGARGSNDRDAFSAGGRGGGRDGHGAGRGASSSVGRKGGIDMEYTAPAVPKFLQAHAHLLRGAGGRQVEANEPSTSDRDGADEDVDQDGNLVDDVTFGLQTALAQNPALADAHPELKAVADKTKAEELKTSANALFGRRQYREAIEKYDEALELDPTNHVVHSNRAAAQIELGQFEAAAESARACIKCAGGKRYAKGYFRLGLALLKLGEARAKESVFNLRRAKELEPSLQGVDEVLFQAVGMVERVARQEKLQGRETTTGTTGKDGGEHVRERTQTPRSKRPMTMLSFADEDED